MTVFTDMISDSMRWKDFISCTASGLQLHLTVICPDGREVQSSIECHVCGHLHNSLSSETKEEILIKAKNGLDRVIKVTAESGALVAALRLKEDAVLIVTGCSCCSESDDQLINKALISQKLLNSFQGSLYEEIKGGQRAVELSTLRQMNHIVLSQFNGNKHALEHSFDLILSSLIILLDAQSSWLSLDGSSLSKQFIKGDKEKVLDFTQHPQEGMGLSVKIHSGNIKGTLGVIAPADLDQAKTLLPLMADECSIVLEIERLFKLINRQLSRVFGTVDSAILIADATGVISYANPGFEKLSGCQAVQLIGQNISRFPAPWADAVKNKPVHNLEGVMDIILDIVGGTKYVNWKLSPIAEDGELFGWLIIINDKTDYYYWQQAVAQAERLSNTSLLLGSLAHEIRNPLSATKGLLQLMGRKRDPESMRSYIDLSLRELDRVTMLLNEFLLLGKPVVKENDPICLAAFLRELMPMMKNDGDLYGIELVLDIKSKPQVQVDSRQLIKVIENLVQNAFEATKSSGRIVVSLFETGQNACIAVRDYGPGVLTGIQDKIFRPFFSTKYRAKGLGLPISQAIIHNHGGDITFCNEADGGTVFNVILPLYDLNNPDWPVDIVICIKDRLICYPVMQSLQAAGFKVLLAEEDRMLDLVKKHKPSVCLLEGIFEKRDLVERIKEDHENMPVIFLGFVEPEIKNLVLQLSLPVNYDQLLNKINLTIKR